MNVGRPVFRIQKTMAVNLARFFGLGTMVLGGFASRAVADAGLDMAQVTVPDSPRGRRRPRGSIYPGSTGARGKVWSAVASRGHGLSPMWRHLAGTIAKATERLAAEERLACLPPRCRRRPRAQTAPRPTGCPRLSPLGRGVSLRRCAPQAARHAGIAGSVPDHGHDVLNAYAELDVHSSASPRHSDGATHATSPAGRLRRTRVHLGRRQDLPGHAFSSAGGMLEAALQPATDKWAVPGACPGPPGAAAALRRTQARAVLCHRQPSQIQRKLERKLSLDYPSLTGSPTRTSFHCSVASRGPAPGAGRASPRCC